MFALPNRVDVPSAAGTLQLLREGAYLAADLDDILGPLGHLGQQLTEEPPTEMPVPTNLPPEEQALYDALSDGVLSLDNLVVATNEGAVRLWKKLGFNVVGTLPQAFQHQRLGLVDAFVMYKQLVE